MAIHTTGNTVSLTSIEHRNQTAAMLPAFKTALGVRGGVHSGLNMTKTSGMGFSISPGRVVVEPSDPAAGPYVVTIDAAERLSFEPGDPTRHRMDYVAVKVDETPGVEDAGSIVILKGPSGTATDPAAPTVPPAHEVLWSIRIGAGTSAGNGGWVASAAIDRRRSLVTLGSPIPVNSYAERNTLATYEGMQVLRRDLDGSIDRFVNNSWRGNTSWVTIPLAPGWTNITAKNPLKIKLIADGMLGMLSGEVKYTGTGTPAEGWTIGSIPAMNMSMGMTPEANSWVIGTDESYRGLCVITISGNGEIKVGPFPTGKVFMFQGTFPIDISRTVTWAPATPY